MWKYILFGLHLISCNRPLVEPVREEQSGDGKSSVESPSAQQKKARNSTPPIQGSPIARQPSPWRVPLTSPPPLQPSGGSGPNSNTSSGCIDAAPEICEVEQLIAQGTNQYRRSSALVYDGMIAVASRSWAKELTFGHFESGSAHSGFPNDRASFFRTRFGLAWGLKSSAENVAALGGKGNQFQTSEGRAAIAEHFVRQWYDSPGHQKNMLGPYSVIGVGVHRTGNDIFAVQIFGSR